MRAIASQTVFSRSGATAQRLRVSSGVRCAAAPLRENFLWRWWSDAEWDLITLDAAHFDTYQQVSRRKVVRKLDVYLRHPRLIRNVADVLNNQRIDGLL